jgi:hypothetical protein
MYIEWADFLVMWSRVMFARVIGQVFKSWVVLEVKELLYLAVE